MNQFITLLLVSFLSVSAMAQFDNGEVPLPPPTGPGNGIPSTPPPPPGQRPPVDNPQYPPAEPSQPGQPVPPAPINGRETAYSLGTAQTTKVSLTEFRFRPAFGLERLYRLQLVGINKKVSIESVIIVYANGMGSVQVPNIGGILRAGENRTTYLTGQPVEEVIVNAGNSSFWRKVGGFRVDVTAITGQ